jgi:hypothetical protein
MHHNYYSAIERGGSPNVGLATVGRADTSNRHRGHLRVIASE